MGRIRMHVALDCSAYSLETFVLDNLQPGSIIVTDSWRGYNFIQDADCVHHKSKQRCSKTNQGLYGVHLVISSIKRLIRGTFQGHFEPKYLQNYLDEYVFRFSRRKSKSIGKKFMQLVQQTAKSA